MISQITPSFQTARAMLRLLRDQVSRSAVQPAHLRLMSQHALWASSDRSVIRQTFDALIFQSLDELGLPRLSLPVEYVAAAIVMFVHPCNYFTMCLWSESHGSTTDVMAQEGDYDQFTARQLFAIVCNVFAEHDGVGCGTFEHKMDCKIRDAVEPIQEPRYEENVDGHSA